MPNLDVDALKSWFYEGARDLPWRRNSTPYAVWVSEVMLQQTQVAVVIPYFERWMGQFPTIAALAAAPLDDVIKAWEGLGYYSRVRNLHQGAKEVMSRFNGALPKEELLLKTIKGLGPYTIGAIRAFAFKQKAAAVDGNVLRLLARHDLIGEDLHKPSTVALMRRRVFELLPDSKPWIVTEALIELGATVCSRQPKCQMCPLQTSCGAYAQGLTHLLPIRSRKSSVQPIFRAVALILAEQRILVSRCKPGKVMSDLHEFPSVDLPTGRLSLDQFQQKLEENWMIPLQRIKELSPVKHSYTRYRATLFPVLFQTPLCKTSEGYFWQPISELSSLAFSAGHRQLLPFIQDHL